MWRAHVHSSKVNKWLSTKCRDEISYFEYACPKKNVECCFVSRDSARASNVCGAVERNRKALREHPFVDKDPWRGYGMPTLRHGVDRSFLVETGATRASQSARPHFAGRRERKRQAQDVLQQKCLGETPARLNQTRTTAPPDKKEKLHENRGGLESKHAWTLSLIHI